MPDATASQRKLSAPVPVATASESNDETSALSRAHTPYCISASTTERRRAAAYRVHVSTRVRVGLPDCAERSQCHGDEPRWKQGGRGGADCEDAEVTVRDCGGARGCWLPMLMPLYWLVPERMRTVALDERTRLHQ